MIKFHEVGYPSFTINNSKFKEDVGMLTFFSAMISSCVVESPLASRPLKLDYQSVSEAGHGLRSD